MNIADVKQLLGRAVKVNNRHFDANTEFILTAYVLRLHRGKLLHQLIIQDASGAEYTVKMEEANDAAQISQHENNSQRAQIRQPQGSGTISVFGTTYEKGSDT